MFLLAHLRYVDEAVYPRKEFYECSELGDSSHLAFVCLIELELGKNLGPGIVHAHPCVPWGCAAQAPAIDAILGEGAVRGARAAPAGAGAEDARAATQRGEEDDGEDGAGEHAAPFSDRRANDNQRVSRAALETLVPNQQPVRRGQSFDWGRSTPEASPGCGGVARRRPVLKLCATGT